MDTLNTASATVSVTDDLSVVSITEGQEQHLRSNDTGLPDGTILSKAAPDWLNNYGHRGILAFFPNQNQYS